MYSHKIKLEYNQLSFKHLIDEDPKFFATKIIKKLKHVKDYILYLDKNTKIYAHNVDKKIICEICKFINFTRELMNNHKEYIIYLYAFPDKKQFTSDNLKRHMLDANNVNSGLTYWDSPFTNGTSVVYRKEEMLKVAVHEVIHAFGFDYNSPIQINGMINPNEAITEAFANLIYICMKTAGNPKAQKKALMGQLEWNGKQAQKILDIYDMTDEFQPIAEITNIKAYYLLKNKIINNGFTSKLLDLVSKHGWKLSQVPNINKIINQIWYETPLYLAKYPKSDKSLRMTVSLK